MFDITETESACSNRNLHKILKSQIEGEKKNAKTVYQQITVIIREKGGVGRLEETKGIYKYMVTEGD